MAKDYIQASIDRYMLEKERHFKKCLVVEENFPNARPYYQVFVQGGFYQPTMGKAWYLQDVHDLHKVMNDLAARAMWHGAHAVFAEKDGRPVYFSDKKEVDTLRLNYKGKKGFVEFHICEFQAEPVRI